MILKKIIKKKGSAEIRTRIIGFKVQRDNRYTTEPKKYLVCWI